jgi:pimeloyl-ACP methyl ester carboxylesterase
VALQFHRDHRERFGALVLTNTRSQADSPEARTARLATAARLGRPGEVLAVEDTVRSLLSPRTLATAPVVVDTVREIVRSVRREALPPTLTALANRPDLTPVLPTIRVPTLVLWGADDQLIPPAQTRQMVEQIPHATGQEITGAGHLPSLENPSAFYGSVARFLSRPG